MALRTTLQALCSCLCIVASPYLRPLVQLLLQDLVRIGDQLSEHRRNHDIGLLVTLQPAVYFATSFVEGGGEVQAKTLRGTPSMAELQQPQEALGELRSFPCRRGGKMTSDEGFQEVLVLLSQFGKRGSVFRVG